MKNNIGTLIAARMGSTRFPKKTLSDLYGEPMLGRLVERLQHSKYIKKIIVATTNREEDNAIENWCVKNKICCYRGSSSDVLGRLYAAANEYNIQTIVEILGDNPLVHSKLIDSTINLFLRENLDYAATITNEYPYADKNLKKFPIGVRVQIFSFSTIDRCQKLARKRKYREHATSFIAENPKDFKIGFIDASGNFNKYNRPELTFAVNTRDNAKLINLIFEENYDANPNFDITDAISSVEKNKNWNELMGDGIKHRKTLMPERDIKFKFERILKGKYAYLTYSILFYLSNKFSIKNIKFLNKIKVYNRLCLVGYEYHFQNFNYKKAYTYRINHALHLVKYGDKLQKQRAKNYLKVVSSDELIEWLDIDELTKYKNDIKSLFNIDEPSQKLHNILFVGPSAKLEKINFDNFEKIVFNKPIGTEDLKLDSKKIILILNNVWSMFRKKEILDWYKKNNCASIISPVKIGIKYESNHNFDIIPKFPFRGAGPMGIQRALFYLMNVYSFDSCHFEGFNFYLSKKSHEDWYPSLRKIEYKSDKKAVIIANMEHDYLLNYFFMKKLLNYSNKLFFGEIVNLINLDFNEVLHRFKENVK